MLKTVVNENRDDWHEHLPYVMAAYRSSPQESTGVSPYQMMYGREMPLPLDVMVGLPQRHADQYGCAVEYVEWLRAVLSGAHEYARQKLKVAARRQKNNYDAGACPHAYQTGDFVWRWYPPKGNRKLSRGWTGPYRIMGVPSPVNCNLQLTPDSAIIRVHIDSLKPYYGPCPRAWVQRGVDSSSSSSPESETDLSAVDRDGSVSEEEAAETEGEGGAETRESGSEGSGNRSRTLPPTRVGRQRRAPDRLGW